MDFHDGLSKWRQYELYILMHTISFSNNTVAVVMPYMPLFNGAYWLIRSPCVVLQQTCFFSLYSPFLKCQCQMRFSILFYLFLHFGGKWQKSTPVPQILSAPPYVIVLGGNYFDKWRLIFCKTAFCSMLPLRNANKWFQAGKSTFQIEMEN